MTTRTPSFSGSMRGLLSHSRNSAASAAQPRGESRVGGKSIVVVVDRSFGFSGKAKQAGLPFLDLLSQPTFGQRQCGFALALGLRLDEVGEPFGLGQIDAAVLERSAGVLTGLRSPQTGECQAH